MTEFELWTPGVGNDHSTNWATPLLDLFYFCWTSFRQIFSMFVPEEAQQMKISRFFAFQSHLISVSKKLFLSFFEMAK